MKITENRADPAPPPPVVSYTLTLSPLELQVITCCLGRTSESEVEHLLSEHGIKVEKFSFNPLSSIWKALAETLGWAD